MVCTLNIQIDLFLGCSTNAIILYLIFTLFKSGKQSFQKAFIPDYIFCGLTLFSAFLYLNANICRCFLSDSVVTSMIIESVGEGLYATQYLLLFVLLFHRLCIVFKKTRYYIQQKLIYLFYIIVVVLLCAGVASILFRYIYGINIWTVTCAVFAMFGCILLICIIIGAFIKRLSMLYDETDDSLTNIIVKLFNLTMLSIVSMLFIILYTVILIFIPHGVFQQVGREFITSFDLLSNLLSVLFRMRVFEKHYFCLFAICDKRMHSVLKKRKEIKMKMEQMRVHDRKKESNTIMYRSVIVVSLAILIFQVVCCQQMFNADVPHIIEFGEIPSF